MNKFIKDKIRVTYQNLKKLSERTIEEVPELLYQPCGYKTDSACPGTVKDWKKFGRYDRVRGGDRHYWFYTEIQTPKVDKDKQVEIEFKTELEERGLSDGLNPQGLVYLNGEAVQGIDINHYTLAVDSDTKYKVFIYFYVGTDQYDTAFRLNIKETDLNVRSLYYDLKVALDAAMCYDEEDYNFIKSVTVLEQVCNKIDFRNPMSAEFRTSILKAKEYMQKEYFEKLCGNSDAVVNYIGHTHIDVAWLWTIAQTREKVQRSFATVLKLMELYPEYTFMSSQPQLYSYLKHDYPELYEKVKKRVKEGRWEVEGAMWLEADCNLASGESLVRQILFGKKFMREEFGVESRVLWLPDVFGYNAALPQILIKSGVDTFLTSKISWSETNKMPYDSFMWEGIDGSRVFTYFLTAQDAEIGKQPENFTTYTGKVEPKMNLGTWNRYQQKEYNNETIVTFGFGDGGGGPTYDMLEKLRRLKWGLPGMPKAQISRAGDFLKRAKTNFERSSKQIGRMPKWVGELYLEFHRGTYTSMAKNKRNNRKCEFLLQETETVASIGKVLLKNKYPNEELENNWRKLLLNQFHDIIPGSSIKEVYDDSDKDYAEIYREAGKIKKDNMESIAHNIAEKGMVVFNPNSFAVSDYVKTPDNEMVFAKNIPPMGWKIVDNEPMPEDVTVSADRKTIESKHYLIKFDDDMNIKSIFDIDFNREIIKDGEKMNQLVAYEDYPKDWDNWEITDYYKQKKWPVNDIIEMDVICGNGYGGFRVKRRYMNSIIEQEIIAYSESRRIDVKNHIDWREHHILLKAEFAADIHTAYARYDIQFGNIERSNCENTSWEAAKFEVCAHKWGDLSEGNYGVSILNDCKYGYSAEGNKMTLSLIKCGTYPNPEADNGLHEFTYSIYPHEKDARCGGTIEEAYVLNRPLSAAYSLGQGNLPSEYSAVAVDCRNIMIEMIKEAESGDGLVFRAFDVANIKSKAKIKFGFNVKEAYVCDLMENRTEKISVVNDEITVDVFNNEIVTINIIPVSW